MAQPSGKLVFAFDENSIGLLRVMRTARAMPPDRLSDLPSLGIPAGTLDVPLLMELGKKGDFALILRDGKMLNPIKQREAWKASNVTLFLMAKKWGQLDLFEMSRRVAFLWPEMARHATQGGQGNAWRVSHVMPQVKACAFRLVTGLHAGE